ncbi:MAG: DedA family protein [Chloroflexi bacterium]|nr:DedA family protein [Chloroflexota bacterium]
MEFVDLITAPYDFFNWIADQGFLAMKALYDRYGSPMVYLAALIESTVGLGWVFPGTVLIFLGGAFAGEQGTSLGVVWLLAIAGTITGDTISYVIGRWGGARLEASRFGTHLLAGRSVMEGRARWLIPFYHFSPWTRAIGAVGAGALRLPLRVWVPLDYLGAIISNTGWVGAGWLLGQAVLTEEGTLESHPVLRLGLAAVAVALYVVFRREYSRAYGRVRAEEDAVEDAAPEPAQSERGA